MNRLTSNLGNPWLVFCLAWLALVGAANAAPPVFQIAGAAVSGTGNANPAWPAHQADDIALLFVESTGGQAANLAAGLEAGFVPVTNSPQATGTGTNGTRITVFWARATSSSMGTPRVTDPGNHVYAQILTYRGVHNIGNPWDVTGGGVKATASTTVTVSGVTTTVADTLVVQAVARDNDSSAAAFGVPANANLAGIAKRSDGGTTSGNGGGFAVWDGVKATAGATGNTTATVANSINAFLTIALKPRTTPSATTNAATGVTFAAATLNGTVSSNGSATTVTFEYGLDLSYGYTIGAVQSPLGAGATNAAVSADLIGLNCNTTFYYRVKATNGAGTTYGAAQTFTTGACSAPYPATACAATRYGSDLGCTAADVRLTNIGLAPSSISSCVSGAPVTLDLDLTVNFSSPDRWDVGIFIANDGKLPTLLPANGGAGSCSVDILPITAPPYGDTFPDLDGAPQGTSDTCGDGNSSITSIYLPGTGSGIKRMTGVTLPCYASAASGGKLFVPFVVTWDNQKSPIGKLCTSNLYPVPNTTSKCNAPASTVNIDVVVMPKITKTNGVSTLNPGANTTYTVAILNDSGGTLLDSVFKDPAVTNLTVTGLSCAAAGGATCPATSIAAMQGAGINIPSANLPNNGSLTFTIGATLSSGTPVGSFITNTATVTIGSHTNSAEDTDEVVNAPAATLSFAPSAITEGNTSVLTVTFTNPTASPVTGVAFTSNYPADLYNAASAAGATTCGGTVTAADNGNSLSLSGGTIPANGSCTVTVNVTSAIAGSYNTSTGTVTHNSGTIPAASGTLTVNLPTFGGFNACDVAPIPNASCTSVTTATDSRITTKIAGSAFSLDIVALNTNGTRRTSYNNNVIIQLLDAGDNSGALDGYNCRSSWTTVIATVNGSFTGPDNGLITVGPFTVPEAYRDVRVKISNSGGSTRIGCSTDNFAIRPNSLAVSVTDANRTSAGTTFTLDNTAFGGVVHNAGRAYTVTATAKNALNGTTANYATTPSGVMSDCAGVACTVGQGVLYLGTPAIASGVLTWGAATYSEAGSFNLMLQDSDFASVDAADTASSCAGRYVCSTAQGVGRFVPDYFELTSGAIVNRSDMNGGAGCAPASAFTYMGEPMKASFTLTARNAAGNTTVKYTASPKNLVRFTNSPANWLAYNSNDSFGLGAIDSAAPTPLSSRLSVVSLGTNGWSSGEANLTAQISLDRTASPDGPYDALAIGVAPTDADGVTLQSAAFDLNADNIGGNERKSLGTTKARFGILKLDNAYGSELLDLRVPVRAMYLAATPGQFLLNTLDSCTTIPPSSIALEGHYVSPLSVANFGNSHRPGSNVMLSGGTGTIVLAKPSPAAVGSVDIAINLNPAAPPADDSSCNALPHPSTTGANLPWLKGMWCLTTGYDKDPSARIRFGASKAPFIYLREMY